MGMWDETCCLTNLPVFPNNPCVVVVLDGSVVSDERQTLNEDGLQHLRAIHFGTYDAYGWIDDVEKPAEAEDGVVLFFHREAWDVAASAAGSEAPQPAGKRPRKSAKPSESEALKAQFARVLDFADSTRRDILVGNLFHGAQQAGETQAYYEKLAKVTVKLLKEQRQAHENRGCELDEPEDI